MDGRKKKTNKGPKIKLMLLRMVGEEQRLSIAHETPRAENKDEHYSTMMRDGWSD